MYSGEREGRVIMLRKLIGQQIVPDLAGKLNRFVQQLEFLPELVKLLDSKSRYQKPIS